MQRLYSTLLNCLFPECCTVQEPQSAYAQLDTESDLTVAQTEDWHCVDGQWPPCLWIPTASPDHGGFPPHAGQTPRLFVLKLGLHA